MAPEQNGEQKVVKLTVDEQKTLKILLCSVHLEGDSKVVSKEEDGNKVGELDPSTGLFTEWIVPTSQAHGPPDVAVSDDVVYSAYFTETDANKIGRLVPSTGVFTEWVIPTSSSDTEELALSGGLIYFTEGQGNKIGRLNPSTGEFTEWTIPTTNSRPFDVAVFGGLVYFTSQIVAMRLVNWIPLTASSANELC